MTLQATRKKKAELPRLGTLCLLFLLIFSFALLLRRADVAVSSMRDGLSLCARAIVPSLFPFMVLSELLVKSGAGEWLISPIARPLKNLLGLSPVGCCAVVLGLVCGFPVGVRCAILGYEKGTVSRSECERILACSTIPSSAFLIGTVGTALWQNAKFGMLLYLCTVLSALLSGIFLYAIEKREHKEKSIQAALPPFKIYFEANMLPSAIKNATRSTLLICAYVVFFSTLTGAIGLILGRFGANQTTHAILSSLLELSGGVSAASMLSNRHLAFALTGAAVGWSGLSVHCQMLSLCEGHALSMRSYYIAKILQAISCPLLVTLIGLLK